MSHNNIDIEKQFSTISISNEDYQSIFQSLISLRTESVKGHLKEILLALKTDDKIFKFISYSVDILKTDLNNWNSIENIKTFFNEFEDLYLSITGRSDKAAIESFNSKIESIFQKYLSEVEMQIKKYISNQDSNLFLSRNILLNFTQLLDIKHFEPILYPMAQFTEKLLRQYNSYHILQHMIVEFILHINHRLVNYLAVVPGNPVSKGLKESIFIYDTVRNNIVSLIYTEPDVITKALNILEHRSRFFGLTADAIPENENHGDYIVVDPLNTAFEDDDVYDDYERFLANLPS